MLMGWKEEDEVVDRVRSIPPVPTYDTCRARLMETLQHSSSEAYTGAALHSAVTAAGLAPPTLRLKALLGGGGTALPTAARLGAHVPSDLDLDELLDRIQEEARATDSLVVGHFQIGAWSVASWRTRSGYDGRRRRVSEVTTRPREARLVVRMIQADDDLVTLRADCVAPHAQAGVDRAPPCRDLEVPLVPRTAQERAWRAQFERTAVDDDLGGELARAADRCASMRAAICERVQHLLHPEQPYPVTADLQQAHLTLGRPLPYGKSDLARCRGHSEVATGSR